MPRESCYLAVSGLPALGPRRLARIVLFKSRMTVRITTVRQGEHTAVRVDGRLLAEDADVLLGAISAVDESVLMDFTDLQGTDDAGVTAILKLIGEGNRIVGR